MTAHLALIVTFTKTTPRDTHDKHPTCMQTDTPCVQQAIRSSRKSRSPEGFVLQGRPAVLAFPHCQISILLQAKAQEEERAKSSCLKAT